MLNARQLDLAIVFETNAAKRLSATPLLDERLFVVGPPPAHRHAQGQTGTSQGYRCLAAGHA